MKRFIKSGLGAVALVTTLGVVAPSVAFASSHSATSHASTNTSAWTTWRASWASYVSGLKTINATFHASLQAARSTFAIDKSAATTPAQRQAARATLQSAIQAAINARVAAITAAGSPPPPPSGYNGSAWVTGFQAANETFRTSVAAAQSTFAQALASATTSAERVAARGALEIAVGNALVARSSALIALGLHPTKPGQPLG